jgi:hypothetical protein
MAKPKQPKGDAADESAPVDDERDPETKIRDWLTGHGFPLEMRVAAALNRQSFMVEQARYFMNHEKVAQEMVKSLFLCECLTREHRVQVVHAAAA